MMYAGAPLHTRGRLGLPGHGAATAHLVVTMVLPRAAQLPPLRRGRVHVAVQRIKEPPLLLDIQCSEPCKHSGYAGIQFNGHSAPPDLSLIHI